MPQNSQDPYFNRVRGTGIKENYVSLGQRIESYWGQPLDSRSSIQGFVNRYSENVNREIVGQHITPSVIVNRYGDKNESQAFVNRSGSIISLNVPSTLDSANKLNVASPREYYGYQAGIVGHELSHISESGYETRVAGEHPTLVNLWYNTRQDGRDWHFWSDRPTEQFTQEERMGLQLDIFRFQDINK